MSLIKEYATAPLLRENGIPPEGQFTAVVRAEQLAQALAIPCPERLEEICLADVGPGSTITAQLPTAFKHVRITAGLECIARKSSKAKVFILAPWLLSTLYWTLPSLATEKIWLWGDGQISPHRPMENFLEKNYALLQQAYKLMANAEDQHVFACRVKALQTGDAGYLPVAPYPEYEHPFIRPQAGDIMLDGGISDMVFHEEKFADAVGPGGAVHGFEPIQWMAERAAVQLGTYRQYHVHPMGLGEAEGTVRFASMRDSSHITANTGENTEECTLTTIDRFVQNAGLGRVDCIKLDIEGCELDALRGASETIACYRPKLIICMYHKPQDMWEIPLYIASLNCPYALHLAHSSCDFTDTILYAAIQ